MVLTSGSRLGPYEIQAALGAGGMGEVYLGHDTKLGRDVALKILPDSVAHDPERVARFRREAQVLAALNHPHIAAIHGLEESGVTQFLVLELVEGETLAQRLERGKLTIPEVVAFARQIAEALEAAHEKGIIHRDLKPANVALTTNDQVKVLDFGLAKALDPVVSSDPSNSPTLTVHATQAGVVLGTAAYMAPEQARGKRVDKRADIWAFGCVLYEMLTGQRAFEGENTAETLGAVLHKEPVSTVLPANTPPGVRTLLRRCLEKDPGRRLHDIADARIELEDVGRAPASADATEPRANRPLRSPMVVGGWIAAFLFAIVAAAVAWLHFRETTPSAELVRFEILAPPQTTFAGSPVLSPDGRQLAFPARGQDGRARIWIRSLDSADARPLPGTEDVLNPVFWSPDSRFVGFAAGTSLKKVDISGKPPIALCDRCEATAGFTIRGGAWSRAGIIIYAVIGNGLWRIPDEGGIPARVGVLDAYAAYPIFLPDGRHFLYTRLNVGSMTNGIVIGSLDSRPNQPDPSVLVPGVVGPGYAPTRNPAVGYLLFVRSTTLMAHPFDADRLKLIGEAEPIAENVPTTNPTVAFSASTSGSLAFRSSVFGDLSKLAWFDREGKPSGVLGQPGWYGNVKFAPDGKGLVVDRIEPEAQARHVWSVDVGRAAFSRPIAGGKEDYAPAVSSDGRVAFTSGNDLYIAPASGAAEPELLFRSSTAKHSNDWSPDGRFLIFDDHHPTQQEDLWILPLAGARKPIPLVVTAADEAAADFSPDGKWFAYVSDESGRREIYVRDFAPDRDPAVGAAKIPISIAGGDKPCWSRDGKELYYIAPNGKLMAVPIEMTPSVNVGLPVPLFELNVLLSRSFFPYDVGADGHLLVNTLTNPATSSPPITVVLNWMSALKK